MSVRSSMIGLILIGFALAAAGRATAGETLSWPDCIREAAKNHPDLIAAEAQVKGNEAGKRIAASGEYPQISASAGAATSKTSGNASSNTYSAGVTGSQLLFDGKKTINDVKAANENIVVSRQNFLLLPQMCASDYGARS